MKFILISFIGLSILLTGCNKSEEYKKGYQKGIEEATEEIAKNKMTFYMSGTHPVPVPKGLKDNETGLTIKFIAGCIVKEEEQGRIDGHNQLILKHINKK